MANAGPSGRQHHQMSRGDNEAPSDVPPKDRARDNVAWSGIRELWEDGELMDVTLEAGGMSFQAHRCYLASCSKYFRSMFTGGFKEENVDVVKLEGVSGHGLDLVLRYMYTGSIEVTETNVHEVLEASSHLQITDVENICADALKESMTVENCVSYLNLSKRYELSTVEDIKKFVLDNFALAMRRGDYKKEVCLELLCSLLKDDRLNAESELQVFQIAVEWINHEEARVTHAGTIMKLVRFGLMTPENMEEVQNHEIMKRKECSQLLQKACSYHMNLFKQPLLSSPMSTARATVPSFLVYGGRKLEGIHVNDHFLAWDMSSKDTALLKPIGHIKAPVYEASAAVVNDFLFVVGGQTKWGPHGAKGEYATNSTWRYDPRNNKWLQLNPMDFCRSRFALFVLADCLIAAGGNNMQPLDSAEKYCFQENCWSEIHQLPSQSYAHAGCCLNGKGYISGGTDGKASFNCLLCYDSGEDTWTFKKEMYTDRKDHVMISYNNCLFVCGGQSPDVEMQFIFYPKTEMYHANTDQWSILTSIPRPRLQPGVIDLTIAERFIFVGGEMPGNHDEGTVLMYDADRDSWASCEKMPYGLQAPIAGRLNLPCSLFRK